MIGSWRRPLLLPLAVLLAVGCSSPSSTARDGGPIDGAIVDPAADARRAIDGGTSAAAGYCEATADAFCGFYLRCGRIVAADQDECRAVFLETCNAKVEPRYVDLEAAGLLDFSPDGVTACADHLAVVECDDQPFDLSGPCAAMWTGQQPVGAACGLDVESFVCGAGEVCVLGLDLCGTCRAAAADGDACGGEVRCGVDSYCDDGGRCRPRGHAGEACSSDVPCRLGLRCPDDVCVGRTYVAEDQACDADHRCPYRSTCTAGSCHRDALIGEPCDGETACTSGRCLGGFCIPLGHDGDACTAGADCASNYCPTDRCAPLPDACFAG